MSTLTTKKQKGFTIIEVALVLAVAALIFLVVFLAVPALQRNQRNDSRRRDVANVVGYVNAFIGNSGDLSGIASGTVITPNAASGLGAYVDPPSGSIDAITVQGAATPVPTIDDVFIVPGFACQSDVSAAPTAGSARSFAVWTSIETAGGTATYCEGS